MYVIERTDQGGGYLRQGGGWTRRLDRVRIFQTREAAERERCPDNEIVKHLIEIREPRFT